VEIIGNGFLATSLTPIAAAHPEVTMFVAGVSSAYEASDEAFSREAKLLYEMLQSCWQRGQRLVYFSTASVGMYGLHARSGREDGPIYPRNPYGRHKLAMEAVITASGADYLILRLATPVGPHQRPHQFLPAMVNQVHTGNVHIHRGARRDLIDIDDVVTIVEHLLLTGISQDVVNVGTGLATPIEDIVTHIEQRLSLITTKKFTDVPTERAISIAKLRRLVPAVADMNFTVESYRDIVDKHLDSMASNSRS
jgi:nucleoside-diphosphate-sugar epimerase